ncbi:formylmethanofuran dehydrogenase subunit E [Lysinibacillus sp. RC46]|uniref:hypothetical protein n=1 Tax=Lysinibacillus sp. RC46 TaxID=3156295 RepID=UPI003519191F
MQIYESHTKEYWVGALDLNIDLEKDYASKAEQLKPAAIVSMRKYQAGQITLKEFNEEIYEYSFYQKRAYEASEIITKSKVALEWFDSIITCSLCGKTFNEADVNVVDYSDDVCVNCEPNYKEI